MTAVNQLLKQFEMMQQLVKQMSGGFGKRGKGASRGAPMGPAPRPNPPRSGMYGFGRKKRLK